MSEQIITDRTIEALKVTASWPGADQATLITLATLLAATDADSDGAGAAWDWGIEAKLLRLFGDNGKLNDNMLMHVLSPYPEHRSALTDCDKLTRFRPAARRAILIFGYDYDRWPMDPAIEAFETMAAARVPLGSRHEAGYDQLAHPVNKRGRVFAQEVGGR